MTGSGERNQPTAPAFRLAADGLSKRYGGIDALSDVSIEFESEAIHALVGENGAGKSTLVRILSGGIRPDAGSVVLDGEPARFTSPRAASEAGIALVEQEPTFVPEMTVAENVFLGHEIVQMGRVQADRQRARCRELVGEIGFALDPTAPAGALSVAQQQELSIVRALMRDARFIILDEPTASLTSDEVDKLFRHVRALRARGLGMIFVSHALDQVLALCDHVSVLRDGQLVLTDEIARHDHRSLVRAMIGRDLEATHVRRSAGAERERVLTVEHLSRKGAFEDVSFTLHAGEVLGLAGLIGSGRTEVARALAGADQADAGTIAIDGRERRFRSPRQAFQGGIAMVPEDRRHQGLVASMSIRSNLSLPSVSKHLTRWGWVDRSRESRLVTTAIDEARIKAAQPQLNVMSLSGGNQQKVVFGKWVSTHDLRVLIADEPTRGVDVGAKEAIYDLIDGLRDQGLAVLLISSDLDEVLRLSDRIFVMRNGRIEGELVDEEISAEAALSLAFGVDR